jgi:hypothetical protein
MRQEKQAKLVINWIFGGLVLLAIVFIAIYVINYM